jgi:hypothetical protein
MVLFFGLGALAAFARSNLTVPEAAGKAMAIYLMVAIGLKGGVAVAAEGLTTELAVAAALGLALSVALPLPAFWLVRSLGRQSPTDAAAIAAHYGSVSVVTFVAGIEILKLAGIPASGYMIAVLALMDASDRHRPAAGSSSNDSGRHRHRPHSP